MKAGNGEVPEPLMSMPEIAELARVKRPVVSNWRRRHPDFPRPVGGTGSRPLFSPRGVAEWLDATGRGRDDLRAELAQYQLAALAEQYQGPDLLAAATALLALRSLTDPYDDLPDSMPELCRLAEESDPGDILLQSEILKMPTQAGWVAGVVNELTEAAGNCHYSSERIMASRHRLHASSLYVDAVTPELAALIAGISGASERALDNDSLVVTDPAAGDGDLLVAVAGLLGEDHEPQCVAAEPDQGLARLLRRRLVARGVPLDNMIVEQDADQLRTAPWPDVLVTRVPYQPSERIDPAQVLDFATEAAYAVPRGSYAVVLGPASVFVEDLETGLAARRAELLKDHMIEAVIRLPGGCVPYRPGYETALWIMMRPEKQPWHGKVLISDVSDRPLTAGVVRDLVDDLVTWRRDGFDPRAHNRVYGVESAVAPLAESLGPLQTIRRPPNPRARKATSDQRVGLLTVHGAELDRIGAMAISVRPHVRTEAITAADLRPRTESVNNLVRQHQLIMQRGTSLELEDIAADGQHVVLGAEEVIGARRPGERRVDRERFASHYPNGRLTEPGDVLVTLTPRPGAIIDWDGYAIAAAPVRILRIPQPRPAVDATPGRPSVPAEPVRLTAQVLRLLLLGADSGTRPAGAVRSADRIADLRLPVLPPGQVQALEAMLSSIDFRREAARREIDMLDEVCQVVASGLTDGTLTVVSDDK